MRAVYRKRLGDHGFDIINILIGFDAAEAQMQVCFIYLKVFNTIQFLFSFVLLE